MAQRYGRNQKRRHREQIVRLELEAATNRMAAVASHRAAQEAMAKLRAVEATIQMWDEDVTRMLGAYSAFRIKPGEYKSSAEEFIYAPVHRSADFSPLASGPVRDRAFVNRVQLLRVLMSVEKHADSLRRLVRLVQQRPEKDVLHLTYQVDESFLFQVGRRDMVRFVETIAREFEERANQGTLADEWEHRRRRHG